MKNILLVSPPIEQPDLDRYLNEHVFKRNAPRFMTYFHSYGNQPIGLLKIATSLRKKGHKVRMIDCRAEATEYRPNSIFRRTFIGYRKCGNFENEGIQLQIDLCGLPYDEFRNRLKLEPRPDEIYVTSGLTYHNRPVHRIIEICKEVFPDATVLLGGIYATLCYDEAKKSKADYVHRGMWEEAKHEWVSLDLLDYLPDRVVIKTSYGCPNSCTYCAVHKLEGHQMDFRDPADVIAEIKDKVKTYGIRRFIFWESNLLVSYEHHFEKILDGILEERLGLRIEFPEGIQPNLLTKDIAEKLRKAGASYVRLPLETSDCLLSRKLKRPSTLEEFEVAVELVKKAGFNGRDITCFILAGLPNQKLENIIESVRHVWKLGCKPYVNPFTPVPMSEDFAAIVGKGMRYEELDPLLWPFASQDMTVSDLAKILPATNRTSALFYVFMMENNKEFLKKVFTENELKYLMAALEKKREVINRLVEVAIQRGKDLPHLITD